MKGVIEKRKAAGLVDYVALALTTFGVGYIPGAPGTYGSVMGVLIYLFVGFRESYVAGYVLSTGHVFPSHIFWTINAILLTVFCLLGVWASGRTVAIFGREDPPQAVVDEVMGQLIAFCFVPFGLSWPLVVMGFLLFRLFDIWKPYPIRVLEILPGGLGICADDIVAGVYAGICLAVIYSVMLSI